MCDCVSVCGLQRDSERRWYALSGHVTTSALAAVESVEKSEETLRRACQGHVGPFVLCIVIDVCACFWHDAPQLYRTVQGLCCLHR